MPTSSLHFKDSLIPGQEGNCHGWALVLWK